MNGSYELLANYNKEINATNVPYFNTGETNAGSQDDLPMFVTIILIVAGTVGNCLVCLAILLDRKLQNVTNYFLLSLAVTDLLIGLLILPSRLITARYEFQPSTFPLCFLYLVGDDFITAASAIHICFISLERYFAIRNPLNKKNLTKRRVTIKIGLVWMIAFLSIIPYMTLAIITEHPKQTMFCAALLSNFRFFVVIVCIEVLIIVIMIVVVVVSFILTTILLYKLSKKQNENPVRGESGLVRTIGGKRIGDDSKNKNTSEIVQPEKKALRVVWLVSFAFIICMAPYTCTSLFYMAFPKIVIPPIILDITAYLNYLNSVINPIIYTIFNKTFRKDFKNIILLRYKTNQ